MIRKLGPYVACLVAGVCSGVGVAYILYSRLNRQIVEIRKMIRELKQDVDAYSDDSRRGKTNKKPRVQYSLTASSGDDDDDFVDCVAGLNDSADAELLEVRQSKDMGMGDQVPAENGPVELGLVFGKQTQDQLTPVEEVSVADSVENIPQAPSAAETEQEDPDADAEPNAEEEEMKNEQTV